MLVVPPQVQVADSLWLAAVAGGAQASGRPVAGLVAGQQADIVVIDDVSLEGLTAAQTLAAAVFANQRRDLVRDVWVGGVRRVQNRRHAEEEASLQGFVAARRQLLAETR